MTMKKIDHIFYLNMPVFWRTYVALPKQDREPFLQMDYGLMMKILVWYKEQWYQLTYHDSCVRYEP